MRPAPVELANGVRALLREIAPQITSPQGIRNVRRAMAILRDVRWNDSGFDVLAENAVLTEQVVLVRDHPGLGTLGETIDVALADHAAPISFVAANARNHRLRGLLCQALDAVAAHDLRGSAAVRHTITQALLARRG